MRFAAFLLHRHISRVRYLTFNFAEKVEYPVGNATDPMLLDRKARSMLMDAARRDTKGFGVLKADGWRIIPVWDYTFPDK